MNSLLIKALLGLSLLGKVPVEPVIVSIDEYHTQNQDSVYLVADFHQGNFELSRQEHADFMAMVKSKENVCVIAEDMMHYDGNNPEVKQSLDFFFRYDSDRGFLDFDRTPLHYLGHSCKENMIPFYNGECRHEFNYDESSADSGRAYDNLVTVMRPLVLNLKHYGIDWLDDYWRVHVDEFERFFETIDDTMVKKMAREIIEKVFRNKAVDIRLLHGLHDMLNDATLQSIGSWFMRSKINDNDRKNIFIFAGAAHINRIIPTLEKQFKLIKSSIDKQRKFSSDRFDIFEAVDRCEKQELINTYRVNITHFFALDKEQESALSAGE